MFEWYLVVLPRAFESVKMVPGGGIEPPTKSLGNFCSIH